MQRFTTQALSAAVAALIFLLRSLGIPPTAGFNGPSIFICPFSLIETTIRLAVFAVLYNRAPL